MAKPNKTQATTASVDAFLRKVSPAQKRKDCEALRDVMERASGQPAKMWGSAIVGFGVRHYKYASGREGEICKLGFSPRAAAISLYAVCEAKDNPAVAALGKVKTGKGCIYIKQLADVDMKKLEAFLRSCYTR